MAQHVMAQVRLPYTTNLPRDVAINTFHYFIPTGTISLAEALDLIEERLIEFYNELGTTERVAEYIGTIVKRTTNACSIRFFLASDTLGPPLPGFPLGRVLFGDPIDERFWTLQAAQAAVYPLPLEVAACVSWQGRVTSMTDAPGLARRRRGRNYIGPLNSYAIDTTGDAVPNLAPLFVTTLQASADRLASYNFTDIPGPGTLDDTAILVVWSRGTQEGTVQPGAVGGVSMENSVYPIAGGWIDDEWDTQRRRQITTLIRSQFNAVD